MNAYPHYPSRQTLWLDGIWEFAWVEKGELADLNPSQLRFANRMAVPGCFDSTPDWNGKRGIGVYRRRVTLATAEKEALRLDLGGMGLSGKLWWDGKAIGEYALPYSGARYDFESAAGMDHELVIALDNRFHPEKMPLFPPYSDFYAFGGIYRTLSVTRLPKTRVERVKVATTDLAAGRVSLEIELSGTLGPRAQCEVQFDGEEASVVDLSLESGKGQWAQTLSDKAPWSPESPRLRTVRVTVAGDTIVERFGLRTIETRGTELLLNGKPLRLRGVNRHETHPQFGAAVPLPIMVEDLQQLRRLGANFVRSVHYPQDPLFFDLCDETGLLAWEESLGWQIRAKELVKPAVADAIAEETRRMVARSVNHPSLIFWGFLNESDSFAEEVRPLYQRLFALIKAEDPTRLVSFASNHVQRDRCFDFVDVISLNLYPGWFSELDWNEPAVSRIAPRIAAESAFFSKAPWSGKPLLISEIGACGIYGMHHPARAQWSEEFQADYMAEAARAVLSDARYCGVTLWQFVDSRSYGPSGEVRGKPNGVNYAGLLDEYRRPKLALEAVRSVFAKFPGEPSGN